MTEFFNICVYRDVFRGLQFVLENIAKWLGFCTTRTKIKNINLAKKASHFKIKQRLKLLHAIGDLQYLLV